MRRTAALAALCALAVAAPAAAQGGVTPTDRAYRHTAGGSGLLEGSDGRAWWLLLSECAGFYGAIANAREAEGDAAGFGDFQARGVSRYRDAVARLQADRGLGRDAATTLVRPHIDRARALAESHLARDPSMGPGTTPAALLRSTCLDLEEAYAAAGR